MPNKNVKINLYISLTVLAAAAVLLISWNTGPFFYHFADVRLVTIYSFLQLLATAFTCYLICKAVEPEFSLNWRKNASARPFLICGIGFIFLGLDEILSLHENIDKLIHHVLFIKETTMTDHIDDVIVLIYGLVAIVFIKDFIREFRKHPYMILMLVCGFLMFFTMFCLDYITNSVESFTQFFSDAPYSDLLHTRDIFRMAEDSAKVMGESFFLAAFISALANTGIKQNKE
ncbi:MAG: hypothetical protein ISS26_01820 [Candidatus Omnitrophica bacterium]|nr:hypothetical protein [Candidatus Omnitrophota bacterium]